MLPIESSMNRRDSSMTETGPLISIIMPCYNTADYLPVALKGLLEQSYTHWELIAVDDASTDGTQQLLAQAAVQDKRIHLVQHQENRGVAHARNTGLTWAQGDYIWFADPDDSYEPELLSRALTCLVHDQADICVFGHWEDYYSPQGGFSYSREVCPEAQLASCNLNRLLSLATPGISSIRDPLLITINCVLNRLLL